MSSDDENQVVSLSGSPILRHEAPSEWSAPAGEVCIEEISAHIGEHLGEPASVFHEVMSDAVHIDVHIVEATPKRPVIYLVTSGMSDLPMTTPPGAPVPRYVELLLSLPGHWRLDEASLKNEDWYWPIRLLKGLARLPHKYQTWLGLGHSVPNGDPPEPYASNTKLSGAIVLPPMSVPGGFLSLKINEEKTIHFMNVFPLYKEEMNLKLRSGTEALLDRLDASSVGETIDPNRRNVAKKRFGLF